MKTVDGYRLTRAGLDDTSPEAHRVLAEAWRRMPLARKWRKIADLFEQGRELFECGERMRRPDASPLEVRRASLQSLLPGSLLPESMRSAVMSGSFSPNAEDLQTLTTVARLCERMGLCYAIGGSIASSLLGQPRFTQDADLCVEPFPGREAEFAAGFPDDYYVSLPAIQEAIRRRSSFNVINTMTSFKVDLFVQKSRPFDAMLMDRRRAAPLFGSAAESVHVVSPEDCVLLKLEWYRKSNEVLDNQWQDVLGVLRVQQPSIDVEYMRRWAAELKVADLLEEALDDADVTRSEGVTPFKDEGIETT